MLDTMPQIGSIPTSVRRNLAKSLLAKVTDPHNVRKNVSFSYRKKNRYTVSYIKSIKKKNKILKIRFKSALTSVEDTPPPEF